MRKLVLSVFLIAPLMVFGIYACDQSAPAEPELNMADQQQDDLSASSTQDGDRLFGAWRAMSAVMDNDELVDGSGLLYIMTLRSDGTHSVSVSNDTENLVCPASPSCSWNGWYSRTATTITTLEPDHPDPGEQGEDTSLYAFCGGKLILMDRVGERSGFRFTFQRTGLGR